MIFHPLASADIIPVSESGTEPQRGAGTCLGRARPHGTGKSEHKACVRERARETDTLGRGSAGAALVQFDKHSVLPLRAPSRLLAATRQHVATCHILARQVPMRQKGLGLFWKTSWRRREGADGSASVCQALSS